MGDPTRTPTKDLASKLENYMKDPKNGVSFPIHIYKGNDISYYVGVVGQEVEINSRFNKNDTYRLTISQNGTASTTTLGIKYLKNRPLEPDWKTIVKQNMIELRIFLAERT